MTAKEPSTVSSFNAILALRDKTGHAATLPLPAQKGAITAGTAHALTVLSSRQDGQHDEQSATLCHDRYTDLYDAAD